MKNITYLIVTLILFSCEKDQLMDEKKLLMQKVEAFQFLSNYHHQLHVMIGEEDGDINKAYDEFSYAITNSKNIELIPIKNAFLRINTNNLNPKSDSINQLDYLVDYYQSGLSMQIEGIFRGYGHRESLEMGNIYKLYEKLKK